MGKKSHDYKNDIGWGMSGCHGVFHGGFVYGDGEGEFVILREVPYRTAYRDPGLVKGPVRAQVRTSPRREVLQAVQASDASSGIIGQVAISLPADALLTDSEAGLIGPGLPHTDTFVGLDGPGTRALDSAINGQPAGASGNVSQFRSIQAVVTGTTRGAGANIQRATSGIGANINHAINGAVRTR